MLNSGMQCSGAVLSALVLACTTSYESDVARLDIESAALDVQLVDHYGLDGNIDNRVRPQENYALGAAEVEGIKAGAISLEAVHGYIALQSFYDAPISKVSACAWVKTKVTGEDPFSNWAIIDFDRSEYFSLFVSGDTGVLGFSTSASEVHDLYGSTSINDGAWHHVCGVYDGQDKHVFVDGELDGSAVDPHSHAPIGTGATRFGFIGDGSESESFNGPRNEFYFDGALDDVRIYHGALDAGLVKQLSKKEPVLVDRLSLNGHVGHALRPQNNKLVGATVSDGQVGQSLSFDGLDDYVALDISYQSPQLEVSVCAWVQTSVFGQGWTDNWSIVDFDRSEYFNLYVNGETGVVGFSTTAEQTHDLFGVTVVADGAWHHVCGTYDGLNKRIFVDGVQDQIAVKAHGGRPLGTGVVRFGFLGDGSEATAFDGERNHYFFQGRIDEVRIYDGAIGVDEINRLVTQKHSGIVDHYPLDDSAENSARPQENTLHGTDPITGKIGGARHFDGMSDVIALKSFYDRAVHEISLCAWVKTSFSGDSWSSNWSIIDFDRSEYFNLYVHGETGAVGFSTMADEIHDLAGVTEVNDGVQWHHICGVYDGMSKHIYVDGILDASVHAPHEGRALGSGAVRFGFIGDGSEAEAFDGARNEFYFQGDIDDVRIFNVGLSQDEITAMRPPPTCELDKEIEVTLKPGTQVEPCAGLVFDVPKAAMKEAVDITVKIRSEPKKAKVRGSPIFPTGLVGTLVLKPAMEFDAPIRISVPTDGLLSYSPNAQYMGLHIDKTHHPMLELSEEHTLGPVFNLGHFSAQAIYDWSSMSDSTQVDFLSWTDELGAGEFNMIPQISLGKRTEAAEICNLSHGVFTDGQPIGLAIKDNGFKWEDDVAVTACVDADFGVPLVGGVQIVLRTRTEACGVSCSGSKCNTSKKYEAFYSKDGSHYSKLGHGIPAPDSYAPQVFNISKPFRYIRVCRGGGDYRRNQLQVDSIRAKGVVVHENGECQQAPTFQGLWSGTRDTTLTGTDELIPPGEHVQWDGVGLIGQKVILGIQLSGTISCQKLCEGVPYGPPLSFPVSSYFHREIGIGIGLKANVPYLWLFKGGWFLARNAVPITEAVLENYDLFLTVAEIVIRNQVIQSIDLGEAAGQACALASSFPASAFVDQIINAFPDGDNVP